MKQNKLITTAGYKPSVKPRCSSTVKAASKGLQTKQPQLTHFFNLPKPEPVPCAHDAPPARKRFARWDSAEEEATLKERSNPFIDSQFDPIPEYMLDTQSSLQDFNDALIKYAPLHGNVLPPVFHPRSERNSREIAATPQRGTDSQNESHTDLESAAREDDMIQQALILNERMTPSSPPSSLQKQRSSKVVELVPETPNVHRTRNVHDSGFEEGNFEPHPADCYLSIHTSKGKIDTHCRSLRFGAESATSAKLFEPLFDAPPVKVAAKSANDLPPHLQSSETQSQGFSPDKSWQLFAGQPSHESSLADQTLKHNVDTEMPEALNQRQPPLNPSSLKSTVLVDISPEKRPCLTSFTTYCASNPPKLHNASAEETQIPFHSNTEAIGETQPLLSSRRAEKQPAFGWASVNAAWTGAENLSTIAEPKPQPRAPLPQSTLDTHLDSSKGAPRKRKMNQEECLIVKHMKRNLVLPRPSSISLTTPHEMFIESSQTQYEKTLATSRRRAASFILVDPDSIYSSDLSGDELELLNPSKSIGITAQQWLLERARDGS